jgi:hypothetical protein
MTKKNPRTGRPYSMKDLTVLALQNDPYRVGTPAGHRDGQWFSDMLTRVGLADGATIHLRGLHYKLATIEAIKPNGTPYLNTTEDWVWLQERGADSARWLGYVPFERIVDHRNAPPVVRRYVKPDPEATLSSGADIDLPTAEDLAPEVSVSGFTGAQPRKLVIFGEKSSLEETLGPIAERYSTDLYLPTGEMSDTLLHQIAFDGAEDGRPMVVFTFSDSDPGGWQMPVSIARKLQALRDLLFPDLEFEVRRVALTPDQVEEYGLPSTPLKVTERRADSWVRAMGVEQTEIDALDALRPELLDRLAREAIAPFFDKTLDRRVRDARRQWLEEAQVALDEALGEEYRDQVREAADRLADVQADLDRLNDALPVDIDGLDLPDIVVPHAELTAEVDGEPLVSSRWSFAEQCRALIQSKAYGNGDGHA